MYLRRILLKELVLIIQVYKKNVDISTRFLINNNKGNRIVWRTFLKHAALKIIPFLLSKPEPSKILILLLFPVLKNRKVIYI